LTVNEVLNANKYTDYISANNNKVKNMKFDLGYKQNFSDFFNGFKIESQNPFLWNGASIPTDKN